MTTYTSHSTQCVTWRCPTHFSACQDCSSVYVSTTDHSPHVVPNCFRLWLLALKDLHCWRSYAVAPLWASWGKRQNFAVLTSTHQGARHTDVRFYLLNTCVNPYTCMQFSLIMVDGIYGKEEIWANKQYQLFYGFRPKTWCNRLPKFNHIQQILCCIP